MCMINGVAYRKKKGVEQKELARLLGISGNAITNWEKERARPDIGLIPDICDILGISFSELFGMDAPNLEMNEQEKWLVRAYRELKTDSQEFIAAAIDMLLKQQKEHAKPQQKAIELPLYGKALAAGVGDPTEFENDAEPFYVYDSPEARQADCVFKVRGDSMAPKYKDGDYVLVQRIPDGPALQYGEIGAFIVGNELYIKEYRENGLHSLNPKYLDMAFDGENRAFLIGRVLSLSSIDRM